MKHLVRSCMLLLVVAAALLACEGDEGPAGPAGKDGVNGVNGEDGTDGNANVTLYSFGQQDLVTNSYTFLSVPTSQDTLNASAWHVYLYYEPLERWYVIPGLGVGGATQYRVSFGYDTPGKRALIYIDKVGTGELYTQARVVRVYANKKLQGGGRATGPDYNNYEAVRDYFGLHE